MAVVHVIPLAEAAVFTAGCALLYARRFDPERMGVVLIAVAVLLGFALLVAATAAGVITVPVSEPDEIQSVTD